MFEIIFRVQVKPAKREEFIEFIGEDIRAAEKSEPGTLQFEVYQDEKDENAFFVHEAYRDEKAFEEHKRGTLFKRWESEILPKFITRFDRSLEGEPLLSLTGRKHN